MVRRSGQQGVPVITVDESVIVGFDWARLEQAIGRAGGSAGAAKPRFGAAVADAARIGQMQGAIPTFGAYVGKVSPGSAADRAGLRARDIIIEINQRRIANAVDVERAITAFHSGDWLELRLLRDGEPLAVQVRL